MFLQGFNSGSEGNVRGENVFLLFHSWYFIGYNFLPYTLSIDFEEFLTWKTRFVIYAKILAAIIRKN
tara:strand:+ start:2062 stop:2262 length:201 start_codon:yes stop_codon:yes gene_type:complete